MRYRLLLSMLGLLAITSTPSAQPTATLEGSWRAVAAERDGTSATDVIGHRLTFAGGKFTITRGRDGKTVYAGTYKTDSAKRPAQIDFDNTNAGAPDHIRRPGRLGPHLHRLHAGEILTRLKAVPSAGCGPSGSAIARSLASSMATGPSSRAGSISTARRIGESGQR